MAGVEDLRAAIAKIAERIAVEADRFRALDAEVGDGDLGVTVAGGCAAVAEALAADRSETLGELFALVGRSFASANPSTIANLLGVALRRVSRRAGETGEIAPRSWPELLAAAIEGMSQRGGAKLGDKTILDALDGSRRRLAAAPADATATELARAAREGAEDAAAAIVALPARAGRAAPGRGSTRSAALTLAPSCGCRSRGRSSCAHLEAHSIFLMQR